MLIDPSKNFLRVTVALQEKVTMLKKTYFLKVTNQTSQITEGVVHVRRY